MYELELQEIGNASRHRLPGTDRHVITPGTERVAALPLTLAASARIPLDEYSIASMIVSEHGSGPPAALLGLAECARNKASRSGRSITTILTADRYDSLDAGHYGRQHGRWAATSLPPSAAAHVAARFALEAETRIVDDAVDFDSPAGFDGGMQGGRPLRGDALWNLDRVTREGWQWAADVELYQGHGVDPYHLAVRRFVGPARVNPEPERAMIAASRVRAGWRPRIPSGSAWLVFGAGLVLARMAGVL